MPAMKVTLPTSGTKYRLIDIMRGTVATTVHSYAQAKESSRELSIQADPANTGNIAIGDGAATASDAGTILAAGQSKTYRAETNSVSHANKFLVPSADGQVATIEWEYA